MRIPARYHSEMLRKAAAFRRLIYRLRVGPVVRVREFLSGHALLAQRTDVEQLARFFRVLSDPACLRLLEFLAMAEHTRGECAAHVGVPGNYVHSRLASLRGCGWIAVRWRGHRRWYRLADPRATEFMLLARTLAADNSGALAECAHLDQHPPCG